MLINIITKIKESNLFIVRYLEFGPEIRGRLDDDFKKELELNIKPFKMGSFEISFSPTIFMDNQTTLYPTLNKRAFDKIFELLNYKDNIQEIINCSHEVGTISIQKYREFLKVISFNDLNVFF